MMWAWPIWPLLMGVAVPVYSVYPDMNAATLLDRILTQRMVQKPQYQPPDTYQNQPLQQEFFYPELTANQRKFAVNPSIPEFYNRNPDFLKFGLEEMEEERGSQRGKYSQQQQDLSEDETMMAPSLPSMAPGDLGVEMDKKDVDAENRGPQSASRVQYTEDEQINDVYFTTIVAVSTALSIFAVVAAGFCYHRISRNTKTSEEVEYPAYGVTGPAKDPSPSGDRKLAQSAQMYHYQHQKNQMIAFGRANGGPGNNSDNESDEGEAEEGDYTVYECPGLASTDEMEVKNPLFNDDPTPNNGNGKPETETPTQNTE